MTSPDVRARAPRSERPPAIVLGLSGTAMGVLRSLEQLGVDTYGVYADPAAAFARHSRRLSARYRVADADSRSEMLRVLRAIRRHAGDPPKMALIACDDTYATFVAAHRDDLEEHFLFRTPPSPIAETFLDKRATVAICEAQGMPIPASFVPHTLEDVEQAAAVARFPVIIKPSRHGTRAFPGKNVIVDDADELLGFYRDHPELITQSMFQEFVPSGDGHLVAVDAYSDQHGVVLGQVSVRKLHQWLPDRGVSTFAVTETVPSLPELTRTFLQDIGYVGLASIEFAEDTQTGEYRFLELNARVINRNQQQADAGVDLNAMAYLEMTGEPPPPGLTHRDGVYWMDIERDIMSSGLKWLRGEQSLREWLHCLMRTSSFAIYDRSDPKPFVAAVLRLAGLTLGLTGGWQVLSYRSLLDLARGRIVAAFRR